MDSCEQREAEEEEDYASGSDMRTVRKLTEETPDAQSVRVKCNEQLPVGKSGWKLD